MDNLKDTLLEVVFAILPITVFVILLQVTILHMSTAMFGQFLIGTAMVAIGLIFFLIGVEIGLLPVGEMIGSALPRLQKPWLIILFSVILGIVATLAEPDVRVLATQVDTVSEGEISKQILIYTVALGVGIFVGIAVLRILLNVPILYLLVGGYTVIFLLALITPVRYAPISFDAGGVTTGPMTVPFILALGVGVASVLGGKTASTDGFGLVALASIGPVIAVLLLGVIYG